MTMPIELTAKDIDAIAYKAAKIVVRLLEKSNVDNGKKPVMVSTKEAAAILHISPGRMRQIAGRFPHIKQGNSKQGKLLFVKDALIDNY